LIAARHYLIRGRVQGVGYRYFAREAAERWNVRGYVRNLGTGDVEIHAEAEESLLSGFRQELERGPRAARVSEVIEKELVVTQTYTSFLIRG
jgi:acylphosphatase